MRVAASGVELEYRAENGAQVPAAIVGQAIVCGVRSIVLGPPSFRFVETIAPTALDGADLSDIEGVFNHNPDILLGRTKSNTMTVARAADGGLTYHIPFDANDPDHNRVGSKIKRGDLAGSSFVFDVKKGGDSWTEERAADGSKLYHRHVTQIKRVYDVCPVTKPAYTDTTTAKRSHDAFEEEHTVAPSYEIESAQLDLKKRF